MPLLEMNERGMEPCSSHNIGDIGMRSGGRISSRSDLAQRATGPRNGYLHAAMRWSPPRTPRVHKVRS